MIQSMTGYAANYLEQPPYRVDLRVRAVNSKYLDLVIRLAPPYQALEDRIRRLVAGKLIRGRVEMRYQIATEGTGDQRYQVHLQRTDEYVKVLQRLQQRYDLVGAMSLELLLQAGAIEPMEATPDLEKLWCVLESCTSTLR